MPAKVIDGTAIARQIRAELADAVAALAAAGTQPGLTVVLVGDDPASAVYVRAKGKACEELGMRGFKWYTAEWRGESRGWNANDPSVFPLYEKALELVLRQGFGQPAGRLQRLGDRQRFLLHFPALVELLHVRVEECQRARRVGP